MSGEGSQAPAFENQRNKTPLDDHHRWPHLRSSAQKAILPSSKHAKLLATEHDKDFAHFMLLFLLPAAHVNCILSMAWPVSCRTMLFYRLFLRSIFSSRCPEVTAQESVPMWQDSPRVPWGYCITVLSHFRILKNFACPFPEAYHLAIRLSLDQEFINKDFRRLKM